MATASSAQREPSMEEILASIRRIIEDSDSDRDIVDEPHDDHDEGNDEPTLGWTADGTGIYGSDVGEDEPSLGSTHSINQETAWGPQRGLWGAVDLEFDGETAPSAD